MTKTTITDLLIIIREFNNERDWEQFHSPKNLAMALSVEVGELLEHFQWLTEEQSYLTNQEERFSKVNEEIADVFIYLLQLSSKLNIDLTQVALEKIKLNASKYPTETFKGIALKYDQAPDI